MVQEYGTGRFNKKHSTFYAAMMRELGLSDETESYLHLVPWQSLAAMNHNFLLTERRRHYLRYLGGLTFFEVSDVLQKSWTLENKAELWATPCCYQERHCDLHLEPHQTRKWNETHCFCHNMYNAWSSMPLGKVQAQAAILLPEAYTQCMCS